MGFSGINFSRALKHFIDRVCRTAHEIGEEFPYYADNSGKWITTADGDWCGGHWVGMLWIAFRRTGDIYFRELALRMTRRLAKRVDDLDMFRGVIHYYSAALGADLLGDQELTAIALRAAEGICDMYNPRARMIPLGAEAKIKDTAIKGDEKGAVDNAMVPLMVVWWAWRRTGRSQFALVATAVTEQVCCWFIRPDGSTWQVGIFEPESGDLLRRQTVLGHSDDSCWTRGQSWLLYGLANGYLYSRRPGFLSEARRVWDFFRRHLPDDLVPYYDLTDPDIPNVPRDTSAAALAAAALLLLAKANVEESAEFQSAGEAITMSLVNRYLAEDGRLLHGCFDLPRQAATDNELIWGSYYLMEALDHLAG